MLDLMDRQILDCDKEMVAKVDDVELDERDDGRLVVTALLTGPGALGPRLHGSLGSITTAIWSRLSGRAADDPRRIDIGAVAEITTTVNLAVSRATVDVDGFEDWARERIITAIPASGHDPT
jgi:hypothetical protein